jgi:uncharacterized protein YecE (DUF72 family)
MKKAKILIGTSGWHYKHWKKVFYPENVKEADQFGYYCQKFETVEINNSFYRLPTLSTFTDWRKQAPARFLFAVKGSRFITHMKKLNVDKQIIQQFMTRASRLKEKLGPILFQLPPHWKINTQRFADFLARLPKTYQYTFEFRNPTWYADEIYTLLQQYNCAFCIYELAGHQSPMKVTADFVYIRLHGPGNKYQGSYPDSTLKKWAARCIEWQQAKKQVYIYFDNDQAAYAAFNALRLMELVNKSSK